MPHFTIDYSPNLEHKVDIAGLCECLRRAGIQTGTFPEAGIRVRAFAATHCAIADGKPDRGYIDIAVRLREGRSLETRKKATAEIFAAAEDYLADALATLPIALSMEMRNIDPELSPKTNVIRRFMEQDTAR